MNNLLRAELQNYGARRVMAANGARIRRLVADAVDRRVRRGVFDDFSDHPLADPAQTAVSIGPHMYSPETSLEDASFELVDARVPGRRIHPPYRYADPEATLLGAVGDVATIHADARRRHPSGVEVREAVLPEAILFGNAVYVRHGGRVFALYESARRNDRTALRPPTPADLRFTRVLPDHPDTVFLGSPGSGNYGHWLTDDLPRAVAADRGGSTRWVMTDHGTLMNLRRQESLQLALGDPTIRVTHISADRAVSVRDLRYMSQPSVHPWLKSPAAIAAARDATTRTMTNVTGRTRLHILRRGGAAGRTLINGPDVERLLEQRGFVTLDPLTASAREQAQACYRADVIVGMMGAAMTNSMFAEPGTAVIHLSAAGWGEPFYADLAAVCGHRYTGIFGATTGTGQPWLLPFEIDIDDLTTALDEAGVY